MAPRQRRNTERDDDMPNEELDLPEGQTAVATGENTGDTSNRGRGRSHAGGQSKRSDRLVLGYGQALNDVRKLARSKYGSGTPECNAVYELIDTLEEGRDDGKSADEIARTARSSRNGAAV